VPFLSVQNLYLYYRTRRGLVKAVDDVSFDMERGTTLALVGESGCGKTSTASAILRTLPRNVGRHEGRVLLDETDLMGLGDEEFRKKIRWRTISIVFQGAMNALSPTSQVGDQVAEPLRVHLDLEKEEAAAQAEATLQRVGLPEYIANRYPHELSGGMKQRVVIAMALVMKPKMVILDEPTSALDVMTQANIINLLKELQEREFLSYLFITHDLGLASELADQLGIMYAGNLVELGPATELYEAPQHPYTRALMNSVPRLRGGQAPESIPGTPPDLIEPPAGCRFHPRCPHAFEPCGWTAPELAEELRSQRTLEAAGLPAIKEVTVRDDQHLVVELAEAPKELASLGPLSRFVDGQKRSSPVYRGIKDLALDGGNVVATLHEPEVPGPVGSSHKASCWLLTRGA